jgi:hypothetical protein
MKKYFLLIVLGSLLFSACDKKPEFEEENSVTIAMAGEWYVHYDHKDYGPDAFGVGLLPVMTYNTSGNVATHMWLSDNGSFWNGPGYLVKIPIDLSTSTFGGTDTVINAATDYPIKVIVENGSITKNAILLPSGTMADSIYFDIFFEDLGDATGIPSDRLNVSGYRKSGFVEDEP